MKSAAKLVACFALCFAVAGLGALITAPNIPVWYASLNKPWFTPPNNVFPIAWNILYALMAIALWRLWETARAARGRAISLFLAQLALNLAWSFIFFGAKLPGAALIAILALDLLVIWTIFAAAKVDRIAAALLLPYLAWIGYATVLNAGIVWLNL